MNGIEKIGGVLLLIPSNNTRTGQLMKMKGRHLKLIKENTLAHKVQLDDGIHCH